jgi:amino acid transporter
MLGCAGAGAGAVRLPARNLTVSRMSSLPLSIFQGYEASAKVAEESKNASRTAPLAIILTVASSGVVGWVYLLATTFSIQNPETLLSPDNATGGTNVFAQVGVGRGAFAGCLIEAPHNPSPL